jgi:hypothetical protein
MINSVIRNDRLQSVFWVDKIEGGVEKGFLPAPALRMTIMPPSKNRPAGKF